MSAGSAASVLNFVINPNSTYDLPFFGGDLVTLPSGHLLALDLASGKSMLAYAASDSVPAAHAGGGKLVDEGALHLVETLPDVRRSAGDGLITQVGLFHEKCR